jgi:Ca2+:H+ antiporter
MGVGESASGSGAGAILRGIAANKLNWLVVALPVALALDVTEASPLLVFITSALAVVPLAGLIGHATEELAVRVGPGVGGLLNATFGNGAELLIGAFALHRGLVDVVKASLSGSIIGNLLLVFGLAIVAGGWGRARQRFSRTAAGAQNATLFLAVVALVMPAVYDLTVLGSLSARSPQLDLLSLLSAVVLLIAYVAGLIFSLRTHSDAFQSGPDLTETESADFVKGPHATMSTQAATILLAVATVLTAVAAEVLVGSVEEASHSVGLNDLFVGLIVVAIVGNAAEHFSAVMVARRGDMQLAMNIATASSVQIALLVAPVLVLLSWAFGAPMSLVFHPFELFGIALAVGAATLVSLDGETNWYEGVLLLSVYALLAISVYFVPG